MFCNENRNFACVGILRWRSSKAARLLSRYKPRGIPHSLNKAELETHLDQTSPTHLLHYGSRESPLSQHGCQASIYSSRVQLL